MNFGDAIKSVLTQYAGFSGRARRSEYWHFVLFNLLVTVVVTIIDIAIKSQILGVLVSLALLLPGLAVAVRRLHDAGRSGWWMFIALIPLAGAIVLLVFVCKDSERGANRFGPSPKYGTGPAGGFAGAAYGGGYPG